METRTYRLSVKPGSLVAFSNSLPGSERGCLWQANENNPAALEGKKFSASCLL